MTIESLIFALSIILGALVWRIARKPVPPLSTIEEWQDRKWYVNARSFALLADRQEELYLKRTLTAERFRKIQRKRTLLAKVWAERIGRNAAMLLPLLEQAASSQDLRTADAARELSNLAVSVRLNSVLAVWCLRIKWMFPTAEIPVPFRCVAYTRLIDSVSRIFGRDRSRAHLNVPAAR